MLFNSYGFIFVFLPLTLLAFHGFTAQGFYRPAFAVLTLASLIFYAWWSVTGLALLLVLIVCNYALTRLLIASRIARPWRAKMILIAALAFNLGVLGYFKYRNFFIANVDMAFGLKWPPGVPFLPLGISFFTFQKIALLVDAYKGKVARIGWLDYGLFVSFFPQLIAGPIVHHSELMPQFHTRRALTAQQIAQGAAIFAIGLAKKVLLADTLSRFVGPVFNAAAAAHPISFGNGWAAALAYTLQLYFDFSGYTDMAIGAALLFGIRLPLNFASPYKAASIIDFWRRWHMTLSRFLRDYLYIPLGGNRHGEARRYLNLFLTMLLGGIWHGAGWTFVLWGALQGAYLAINHLWRAATGDRMSAHMRLIGPAMTFVCVVAGWVVFRAADIDAAGTMLRAMAGLGARGAAPVIDSARTMSLVLPLLALVWLAPNTQELTDYSPVKQQPAPARRFAIPEWGAGRAAAVGALFALSVLSLSKVTEFIYFQF